MKEPESVGGNDENGELDFTNIPQAYSKEPPAVRSDKFFWILGLAIHILIFPFIIDLYFTSPIRHGMAVHRSEENAFAKRLVVFIADGLRAEAIYPSAHANRTEYLSDLRFSGDSAWGVAHTGVPTESRPGHVAIFAGIFEDPSAILTGWQKNVVEFDSVINESNYAWSMGSPDVVNIFSKQDKSRLNVQHYDPSDEDFSGKSSTINLDKWVFERIHDLLTPKENSCKADAIRKRSQRRQSEETNRELSKERLRCEIDERSCAKGDLGCLIEAKRCHTNLADREIVWIESSIEREFGFLDMLGCLADYRDTECGHLCEDRNIFFLHLLGMDTVGHVHKPDSIQYVKNLAYIDKGIRATANLFEDFFNDNQTAFLFTSDHGMTNWGAHGDGSEHETEVPYILWGAGVRGNRMRRDVKQVDFAPLLSSIIGVPVPINSMGILPHHLLKGSRSQVGQAVMANVLQHYEQYELVRNEFRYDALFQDYPRFKGERVLEKRIEQMKELLSRGDPEDVAVAKGIALIEDIIAANKYLRDYYYLPKVLCICLGFGFWFFYLTISIHARPETVPVLTRRMRFLKFFMRFWQLAVSGVIVHYMTAVNANFFAYLYPLFPIFCSLLITEDNTIVTQIDYLRFMLNNSNFFGRTITYALLVEGLVLGFFNRHFCAAVMCILAVWLTQNRLPMKKNYYWGLTTLGLAASLIVEPSTKFSFTGIVVGTALWSLVFLLIIRSNIFVYMDVHNVTNKNTIMLFLLAPIATQIIACVNNMWVAFDFDQGSKRSDYSRLLSWFLTAISLAYIPNAPRGILVRLGQIAACFVVPYTLMAVNIDLIFYGVLVLVLFLWIDIEARMINPSIDLVNCNYSSSHRSSNASNRDLSSHYRRTYFYLALIICYFFAIGNMASFNGFDPLWTRAYVATFNPMLMCVLIVFKMVIPFFVITCALYAVVLVTKSDSSVIFKILIMFLDQMVINFMVFIRNEGSWKDIGKSISHFVVMEAMALIILLFYLIAKYVCTVRIGRYDFEETDMSTKETQCAFIDSYLSEKATQQQDRLGSSVMVIGRKSTSEISSKILDETIDELPLTPLSATFDELLPSTLDDVPTLTEYAETPEAIPDEIDARPQFRETRKRRPFSRLTDSPPKQQPIHPDFCCKLPLDPGVQQVYRAQTWTAGDSTPMAVKGPATALSGGDGDMSNVAWAHDGPRGEFWKIRKRMEFVPDLSIIAERTEDKTFASATKIDFTYNSHTTANIDSISEDPLSARLEPNKGPSIYEEAEEYLKSVQSQYIDYDKLDDDDDCGIDRGTQRKIDALCADILDKNLEIKEQSAKISSLERQLQRIEEFLDTTHSRKSGAPANEETDDEFMIILEDPVSETDITDQQQMRTENTIEGFSISNDNSFHSLSSEQVTLDNFGIVKIKKDMAISPVIFCSILPCDPDTPIKFEQFKQDEELTQNPLPDSEIRYSDDNFTEKTQTNPTPVESEENSELLLVPSPKILRTSPGFTDLFQVIAEEEEEENLIPIFVEKFKDDQMFIDTIRKYSSKIPKIEDAYNKTKTPTATTTWLKFIKDLCLDDTALQHVSKKSVSYHESDSEDRSWIEPSQYYSLSKCLARENILCEKLSDENAEISMKDEQSQTEPLFGLHSPKRPNLSFKTMIQASIPSQYPNYPSRRKEPQLTRILTNIVSIKSNESVIAPEQTKVLSSKIPKSPILQDRASSPIIPECGQRLTNSRSTQTENDEKGAISKKLASDTPVFKIEEVYVPTDIPTYDHIPIDRYKRQEPTMKSDLSDREQIYPLVATKSDSNQSPNLPYLQSKQLSIEEKLLKIQEQAFRKPFIEEQIKISQENTSETESTLTFPRATQIRSKIPHKIPVRNPMQVPLSLLSIAQPKPEPKPAKNDAEQMMFNRQEPAKKSEQIYPQVADYNQSAMEEMFLKMQERAFRDPSIGEKMKRQQENTRESTLNAPRTTEPEPESKPADEQQEEQAPRKITQKPYDPFFRPPYRKTEPQPKPLVNDNEQQEEQTARKMTQRPNDPFFRPSYRKTKPEPKPTDDDKEKFNRQEPKGEQICPPVASTSDYNQSPNLAYVQAKQLSMEEKFLKIKERGFRKPSIGKEIKKRSQENTGETESTFKAQKNTPQKNTKKIESTLNVPRTTQLRGKFRQKIPARNPMPISPSLFTISEEPEPDSESKPVDNEDEQQEEQTPRKITQKPNDPFLRPSYRIPEPEPKPVVNDAEEEQASYKTKQKPYDPFFLPSYRKPEPKPKPIINDAEQNEEPITSRKITQKPCDPFIRPSYRKTEQTPKQAVYDDEQIMFNRQEPKSEQIYPPVASTSDFNQSSNLSYVQAKQQSMEEKLLKIQERAYRNPLIGEEIKKRSQENTGETESTFNAPRTTQVRGKIRQEIPARNPMVSHSLFTTSEEPEPEAVNEQHEEQTPRKITQKSYDPFLRPSYRKPEPEPKQAVNEDEQSSFKITQKPYDPFFRPSYRKTEPQPKRAFNDDEQREEETPRKITQKPYDPFFRPAYQRTSANRPQPVARSIDQEVNQSDVPDVPVERIKVRSSPRTDFNQADEVAHPLGPPHRPRKNDDDPGSNQDFTSK